MLTVECHVAVVVVVVGLGLWCSVDCSSAYKRKLSIALPCYVYLLACFDDEEDYYLEMT